jgi:hypothetical protein
VEDVGSPLRLEAEAQDLLVALGGLRLVGDGDPELAALCLVPLVEELLPARRQRTRPVPDGDGGGFVVGAAGTTTGGEQHESE